MSCQIDWNVSVSCYFVYFTGANTFTLNTGEIVKVERNKINDLKPNSFHRIYMETARYVRKHTRILTQCHRDAAHEIKGAKSIIYRVFFLSFSNENNNSNNNNFHRFFVCSQNRIKTNTSIHQLF